MAEDNRIAAAYAQCERIARREGRNFHWGFRFLPETERRSLCALYAFARRTDDIVDEPGRDVAARTAALEAWRRDTEAALSSGDSAEPLLLALVDAARRHRMPQTELHLLIEGCRDDLTVRRYATFPDTLGYCRKVAVTVGLSMLAIFDARDDEAAAAMTSLGLAFQMTNILRDIPEDLGRDRIYLAAEDLSREGISEAELRAGTMTPRLRRFMMEMVERTEKLYDEAKPLYERLTPSQSKTMRAMMRIYRAILDEIRRQEYDVWMKRPRVPTWRKLAIVATTAAGL